MLLESTMLFKQLTVLLVFLSRIVIAQPNPGKVTGDISVHDPTMCRNYVGTYFIFGVFIACLYTVLES